MESGALALAFAKTLKCPLTNARLPSSFLSHSNCGYRLCGLEKSSRPDKGGTGFTRSYLRSFDHELPSEDEA